MVIYSQDESSTRKRYRNRTHRRCLRTCRFQLEQRSLAPLFRPDIPAPNGTLRLHVHGNSLHYRMLQPILADCISRGRRKSAAGTKRERKIGRIKEHIGGGIRGGRREMPINESASAKSRLGAGAIVQPKRQAGGKERGEENPMVVV